ncbi:MAG: hypothetical protein ACQEP1_06670 [Nanobdellota archaeon]
MGQGENKTQVLYIGDNPLYLDNTLKLFGEINNRSEKKYNLFPDNIQGFHEIRKRLDDLASSMREEKEEVYTKKEEKAKKHLNRLAGQADILVLGYKLLEDDEDFNGIELYKEMDWKHNGLIYTISNDIESIGKEIKNNGLVDKMNVLHKPKAREEMLSEDHVNKVRYHLENLCGYSVKRS